MTENVLIAKNVRPSVRLTVKGAIALGLIALAVGLPQIVHIAVGASGGAKWLPMYLPVLLGGLILGVRWGLGIGLLSPLVSFGITAAFGNAMPAATRLPFMMAELAVFGAVSGLFSKKIPQNKWLAFPAVLTAEALGRATFIALVAIFQSITPFSVADIWAQIQTGFVGLLAQALIAPSIVILLAAKKR